ncbi:hypothetical protein V6N13_126884 [Hibiscus sabdariffa]
MVAIFSWGERLYYIAYRYEIPKEEKKGIWLKLSVEKSDFILVVVMEAFEYHQTEKGYMTPTYCLSERLIILSANASHQVSVEGFVIHEINMVLVVQEKYCVLSFTELWKIPSCSIVESDEIFTGVVKEVKEEIEIDNKFMEVVSFRQVHDVASEKSDLPIIFLSEISTSAYIVVGLTDAPRRAVIRHTFLTTYANQVVAPMVHKVNINIQKYSNACVILVISDGDGGNRKIGI